MHHMVLDQPSSALLQLFMKHYYLRDFVTVETRYTIWKRFMDEQRPASKVGVRHLNTGHTYTTNPRDYLGGPWPISSSIGTKVEHPFVNWHQPTTCVPGYHYELSPSQQRWVPSTTPVTLYSLD
ncbi:hypothetical protein RvY_01644 [Ramazzottius varieornatus]|uniref:N-acetyltransferase domain-containing protein n=1 Tax=Ramazzottius varieornatus TaxID=947166 RepID=A0A1D1USA5_RAMVA|nr:hypothetical protein RvY_01644 [Ramazzottius varieornatus]